MENTNEIKIGRSTFDKSTLNGTIQEAIDKFEHIDSRIVAKAWKIANPEPKKVKKRAAKKQEKTNK